MKREIPGPQASEVYPLKTLFVKASLVPTAPLSRGDRAAGRRGPIPLGAVLFAAAFALACPSPEDLAPTPTPAVESLTDPVAWDNATVYFVITDRFLDGDPSNNNSYGRQLDGGDEIGTFHGGDLAGLTQKLEEGYFNRLGVSAIWITAPYEQAHGWLPSGGDEFKHYAYHGYYALDYTNIDANMGSPEDFGVFVDAAHAKGVRVVLDVVMNHPGYATIQDLAELGVDVLKPGWEGATLSDYYPYIAFESDNFADWWGVDWVRAGLGGGYEPAGNDDLTRSLASLPDFKTEATALVSLPPMLARRERTSAVEQEGYTVRDYMVEWLTTWVSTYGVDGFRCDTAKHVDLESWAALKDSANAALVQWRANNPDKALPDSAYLDPGQPFWMTGEVFPHGVVKDAYFSNGFDSLINFDYQAAATAALDQYAAIDSTWASYAQAINSDADFNVLSYLSSHDTSLFFNESAGGDVTRQARAGTLLLLSPGAVQIFYGDENARPEGPGGSDATQGTRSDYRWGENPELLEHWRRVGQFRRHHRAVGAGSHEKLNDAPYTFRRSLGDDHVYVVLGAEGKTSVDVSADFADGSLLTDAYTGQTAEVSGGAVKMTAGEAGVLLIEQNN